MAARPRPKLIVVPGQQVGRTPFVMLVGGLLLGGLVALLMLHTLAAQDAFRQTSLQQRLATLTDAEQHLQQQVQLDSSPAALRARAKALGMVPSVITGYRRLPDGRVIAHEVAATAAAPVTTTVSTTPIASTKSSTASTSSPTTAKTTPHRHHGAARR